MSSYKSFGYLGSSGMSLASILLAGHCRRTGAPDPGPARRYDGVGPASDRLRAVAVPSDDAFDELFAALLPADYVIALKPDEVSRWLDALPSLRVAARRAPHAVVVDGSVAEDVLALLRERSGAELVLAASLAPLSAAANDGVVPDWAHELPSRFTTKVYEPDAPLLARCAGVFPQAVARAPFDEAHLVEFDPDSELAKATLQPLRGTLRVGDVLAIHTAKGVLAARAVSITSRDAQVEALTDGVPGSVLLDKPAPKGISGRGGMVVRAGERGATASLVLGPTEPAEPAFRAKEKVVVRWLHVRCEGKVAKADSSGLRIELSGGAQLPVAAGDRVALQRGTLRAAEGAPLVAAVLAAR